MFRLSLISLMIIALSSCKINYKFSDVQVKGDTAKVSPFLVQAPLAPPASGQIFTEQFQDMILAQSKLELVNADSADILIDGNISYYEIRPEGVQNNDVAAQNRLTIRVDVNYVNKIDPQTNFTQSFTRFANYQSTIDISSVESELMEEIFDQISQDIFNRAFGSW